MSDIDAAVDRFFDARAAIFAHVGYVENWRVLPIDDSRDQFWAVDEHEREWVKFSPEREALAYWLAEHDDEYGSHGDVLYENVIYTQRFLPKWVYRGTELTLVVSDTRTDDNKYLQLFRNENELRVPVRLSPSTVSVMGANRITEETRRALDEITCHSNARTGDVARAIEAGLIALGDGSALAERHLRSLHEWVSMVSECGGVGDRWRFWRDAVMALLRSYEVMQRG